jgi:hypothetical protein
MAKWTPAEQKVVDTIGEEGLATVELASGKETIFTTDPSLESKDIPGVSLPRTGIPLTDEHRKRDEAIVAEVRQRGLGGEQNLIDMLSNMFGPQASA